MKICDNQVVGCLNMSFGKYWNIEKNNVLPVLNNVEKVFIRRNLLRLAQHSLKVFLLNGSMIVALNLL
jgi:hypothetical protein